MNRRDLLKLFAGTAGIPAVTAVERLTVEPCDVLVLKFKERLSQEACHSIDAACTQGELGRRLRGIPVMILDGGADIQTLRLDAAATTATL